MEQTVRCPHCGAATEARCQHCGGSLIEQAPPPPPVSTGPPPQHPPTGSAFDGLVPYRNAYALAAYYCAVFALIPCIGSVLGIAAFVLGIMGLRFYAAHPEARGKTHAWVGIILGGLCGVGWIALVVISIGAGW